VQIVAERGLHDLTLAECGQAAGYSRGLAAHYFGSRDALISSIARYIVDEYIQRLRTTGPFAKGPGQSAIQNLLDRIAFYINSTRVTPEHTRAFQAVLSAAVGLPALAAVVIELNRSSIAGFAATIRAGIAAGEIRPDVDPEAQGSLMVAMMRGVVRQWVLDPSVDLDAIGKALMENVRRSLAL
jgi:AcrR family transcriptional regulator